MLRRGIPVAILLGLFLGGLLIVPALAKDYTGTSGDDVIEGTASQDTFDMQGGADTVWARGGPDILHMDQGADRGHGEDGGDVIYGGDSPAFPNGFDALWGGIGNDTITDASVNGDWDYGCGGQNDDGIYLNDGDTQDWATGGTGSDSLSVDHGEHAYAGDETCPP
jgi:Ca2+-binding RTX toxin-like protein